MDLNNFLQSVIFFILFIISIIIFQMLNLDINFITTFIITIFTLSISIFFFIESNKISNTIKEKLSIIKERVDEMWWHNSGKVKDLNISST